MWYSLQNLYSDTHSRVRMRGNCLRSVSLTNDIVNVIIHIIYWCSNFYYNSESFCWHYFVIFEIHLVRLQRLDVFVFVSLCVCYPLIISHTKNGITLANFCTRATQCLIRRFRKKYCAVSLIFSVLCFHEARKKGKTLQYLLIPFTR